MDVSPFLYLTTRGWKTGKPHQIEIWFVELEGRFYLISERGTGAHWVQNLTRNPQVTFLVGGRDYQGTARTVDASEHKDLAHRVQDLFRAAYDWNEGLIVELAPNSAD